MELHAQVMAVQFKGVTWLTGDDSLPKLKYHLTTSDVVTSQTPRAFSGNNVTARIIIKKKH